MPTYPTAQQVYDALPRVNLRPIGALRELMNICRQSVNPGIAKLNTELGLSGKQAIPAFDHFRRMPAKLTDAPLNSLLLDWHVERLPSGTQDRNSVIHLTLTDLQGRCDSPNAVDSLWDRTGAVDGALYYAAGGWPQPPDPAGRLYWVQLVALDIEALADPQDQFTGVVMHYQMTQGSGVNNWQ